MKETRLTSVTLILVSSIMPIQLAQAATVATLGTLDFPNSGKPEAQDAFYRGVLLLHSFEYEDAREAFQQAQAIDPGFALAYWGEAMTHNHPLWRQQDRTAARDALAKLAPTAQQRLAETPTERERGYLAALEVLYGDGDKVERDVAYASAMRDLSRRYPDDLEAKSFYALSILGTTQGLRDFRTYMRAGAIVEEVFAENPRHPGAVHYLIHSYDDPVHAPLGLRAARVYADISPAASHAQHMISHIYVALGEWADSVDSNVKAFEVSRERQERKGLGVDALNYHAFHWLAYSYLQLGRFEDARRIMDAMRSYAEQSGTARSHWHYAAMRANWAAEAGGLNVPASLGGDAMSLNIAAMDLFATGYAAASAGDTATAERVLEQLTAARQAATQSEAETQHDVSADVSAATLEEAEVMEDCLRALLELEKGRNERALELLAKATAVEGARPLEYGPPSIPKPSHELYGEVLLRLDRPEEALTQFERALERAPRRRLALAGLAKAAEVKGDQTLVGTACSDLTRILAGADSQVERPGVCG